MKVLIDASPAALGKGAGYYRHVVCLLKGLALNEGSHRYHVVTKDPSLAGQFPENGHRLIFERPPGPLYMLHRKGIGLVGRIPLIGFDLVHFPCTDIWYSPRGKKAVVTLHDLAPLHFPDRFFKTPEEEKVYHAHLDTIVSYATKMIAVSDHTRQDAISSLGITPDKITTVYNSVDPVFLEALSKKESSEVPYFLFVGDLDFRKNIPLLLQSFSTYRKRGGKFQLVLVGKSDPDNPIYYPPLGPLLEALKEKDQIRRLEGVSDKALAQIYKGAAGLVFPSSFEGFGFPLVEAMAAEIPVITVTTSCLPEIVGDAGLVVPLEEESLAEAMLRIEREKSLREDLIERGRKRLQNFLPRIQGQETLAIYRKLSGGS